MAVRNDITAFMEDPDAIKPNPIHSTSVAKDYGFEGALVGGATAYGWTAQTVMQALGEQWLDYGWAEVSFKRPIYPGDALTIAVSDDGALSVGHGDVVCFMGRVGLGDAPWRDEFAVLEKPTATPPTDPMQRLTLDIAPVGQDLATRAVRFSIAEAQEIATVREGETDDRFCGDAPRVHPAWIAEQPIHWLHHSYDYGPSIHAKSRIQHVAPAYAGQTFSVAGRCIDAYERKGHHYIVNDTELLAEDGRLLAQVRHTSVFQVAKKR